MKPDWNKLAANLLKAELKRRGISYAQLETKLSIIGVTESADNIKAKVSRGTFQFAFFLQCATAIGLKNLRLDEIIPEG